MKRLVSTSEPTSSDRLSLYRSTIFFQWLFVALVAWRCSARTVGPEELGISTGNPWQVAWTSLALTGVLCLGQVIALRKLVRLPEEKRGSVFTIMQKLVPQSPKETLTFAALACTAGVSEEFLYRGFAFAAFTRMLVNYGPPNAAAAVLSSAWFSLAHLYQGRRGIVTTFVVGILFAFTRIWTGSLIPVITAHIGIDLVAGVYMSRLLQRA